MNLFQTLHNFTIYSKQAPELAAQYEQLSPENIHGDWLAFLPEERRLALAIGAGTGRDATWLKSLGFDVVAVEPVPAMRQQAQAFHPHVKIHWIDDSLPFLEKTQNLAQFYDLILLSAVWMHLDQEEQAIAMKKISKLISSQGRIIITLRHGESPDERVMHSIHTDYVIELVQKCKLQVLELLQAEDFRKRRGVFWETLVLVKKNE